jgi:hypothetical protein
MMNMNIIDRLHRNAVKQRLFRRFVRRRDSQEHPSDKRTADIYFLVHYAGMSKKHAAELFGVSQTRVGQIISKGDKLIKLNSFQICHPRGSCLVGAINT